MEDLHTSALIVVDPQNDFGVAFDTETKCSGSLYVNNGEKIINNVNQLLQINFNKKYISLDSHPEDHCSFQMNNKGSRLFEEFELESGEMQMMWPTHCVVGTWGHEIMKEIKLTDDIEFVKKGTDRHVDSYSAFYSNDGFSEDTGLYNSLCENHIDTVVVCGLALDYCVGATCLDALKKGFKVVLLIDTTFAVDEEDGKLLVDKLCETYGDQFKVTTFKKFCKTK